MAEIKIPLTTLVLGSVIAACNNSGSGSVKNSSDADPDEDTIVGDWNLSRVSESGYGAYWSGLNYSYAYDGNDSECGSYTYSYSLDLDGILSVNQELVADFSLDASYSTSVTYEDCDELNESGFYSYLYTGTAVAATGGAYEIALQNDEYSLSLNCTIENARLACNASDWLEDSDHWTLEFDRDGK